MQQERSRMLGEMKMSKLVTKISVPIMVSMLIQGLYNIVDGIFVARYSAEALTAVSLVMPIQMLMIAVSTGLGVGINSLVSRRLGEKRSDEARTAARNGVFLELIGFALFFLFGAFAAKPFMKVLTPDAALQQLGGEYLSIVTMFSFGLFLSIVFERLMQATGNTVLSMLTQATGAVINIILDPVFIFTFDMGVTGAAVATVIGQVGGMTLGIFLNQCKNKELKISVRGFKPDGAVIKGILTVGFPSVIMQSIASVMNVLMNMILLSYGNTPVNVLGVYFKLQSFVFMPVFGLSNGMVAIVGYNFGARNRKRVYESIKVALKLAGGIMLVGMCVFMLIPDVLLSLFEADGAGELTELGRIALRIISINFLPAAVGITLSTVFQAVGKGTYSLIMSLCRQLVVLVPAAWILISIGGPTVVWWSFPISEVVSLCLCLVMFRRIDRKMLKTLEA
ncbi:MAG: MATE family efflux transporter [Clostridia bacterium]|nr:MATE family efflux transporter [Clostridia bacterium]